MNVTVGQASKLQVSEMLIVKCECHSVLSGHDPLSSVADATLGPEIDLSVAPLVCVPAVSHQPVAISDSFLYHDAFISTSSN